MIRIAIPSEVVNVANFLLLDVLLLPYVLFLSGKLAGFSNDKTIANRGTAKLVDYRIPAIGGGMVTSPGWHRRCLIAIRLSVLIFVAIANLGIEGRTVDNLVTREAVVRVPGPFEVSEEGVINALGEHIECNEVLGDRFVFGSVIDNKCFKENKDFVTIHEMSAPFVERNVSMHQCEMTSKNCQRTMYRCETVDLYCNGVSEDTGCENPSGIIPNSCAGIAYDDDDEGGVMCNSGNIISDSFAELHQCRHFAAKREDIVHWNESYEVLNELVDNGMISVFATAYGKKSMQNVTVLEDLQVVTDISLVWLIPASLTFGVCLALTGVVFFQYYWVGSTAVAHDERGLLKLLGQPMQVVRIAGGDNEVPGGDVGCTIFL